MNIAVEHREFTLPEGLTTSVLKEFKLLPSILYKTIDEKQIQFSHYVGVLWLTRQQPIVIMPKNERIDFYRMFSQVFNSPLIFENEQISRRFSDIYKIFTDQPPIEIERSRLQVDITILQIIHLIRLVQKIVRRGLKKDYVIRQQNLRSRLRGKILMSKHIKQNLTSGKNDFIFQSYQDYVVDNLENRILKKALLLSLRYIDRLTRLKMDFGEYQRQIRQLLPAFNQVSEQVSISDFSTYRPHRFYKYYDQAIAVAQLIIRCSEYTLQTSSEEKTVVLPFYVDMALLYEFYVLGLLSKTYSPTSVAYQYRAKYGYPDYLLPKEKIILDAKYKDYSEYDIEDIRQLSGYSRDCRVIKKFGYDCHSANIPHFECIIIYPQETAQTPPETIDLSAKTEIDQFNQFYKLGISLPERI